MRPVSQARFLGRGSFELQAMNVFLPAFQTLLAAESNGHQRFEISFPRPQPKDGLAARRCRSVGESSKASRQQEGPALEAGGTGKRKSLKFTGKTKAYRLRLVGRSWNPVPNSLSVP